MTDYIRAKIKDREQFKQVFPLPVDGEDVPEVGRFILSILGQTTKIQKRISPKGTFYYVTDIDHRWVIIPNRIEYFDTPTNHHLKHSDDRLGRRFLGRDIIGVDNCNHPRMCFFLSAWKRGYKIEFYDLCVGRKGSATKFRDIIFCGLSRCKI